MIGGLGSRREVWAAVLISGRPTYCRAQNRGSHEDRTETVSYLPVGGGWLFAACPGRGKSMIPLEAIAGRDAILCHSLPKPGWFTDTASSGSIAACCMVHPVPSVSQPMRLLSKEESGDRTRVRRRWCMRSSRRSHISGISRLLAL